LYEPETVEDIWEYEEMQDFMFIVFKDCLKTKKGQQLIHQFELTRDARLIYYKLKDHAMSLKVLQLSVDTSSGFRFKDNDVTALSGNAFGDVWLWEEQTIEVEEIEFEEVPSQKIYGLLHTNIVQGTKPAYNHHTSGHENIKDRPEAAPNESIELMDLRPSTYKTQKTCPCLKKQGIDAGSTSIVVRHCLADDDPNGEQEAMMVDADLKLIVFNPNKTRWYSNKDTIAGFLIRDFIPQKRVKLMFDVEIQSNKGFSAPDLVDDAYDFQIWKLNAQGI
jgi:hypothetical protein